MAGLIDFRFDLLLELREMFKQMVDVRRHAEGSHPASSRV